MSFYSPQFHQQNARHFLAVFLLFASCYQMAAEAGGAGKHKHFPNNAQKPLSKSATQRKDNLLFNALSKIIPHDPEINRINPPSDYLRVILNASGVLGLGFLWIKEITGALGTPILAPILMPPLFVIAFALLFIPDLSRLGEIIDNAMPN